MSTRTSKDGGGSALADEDIVMKTISKEKERKSLAQEVIFKWNSIFFADLEVNWIYI
jgi:hypothetical protein